MNTIKRKNSIVFETTIPVFSWFIAKGMAVGFMIPMAIIGAVTVLSMLNGGHFSDFTPDIYYAIGFVGALFFFTYIVMAFIFPNGFVSRITISDDGISQVSLSPSKTVNQVVIIGGILKKSSGAVGTGLLAVAGDNRIVRWKDMRIVKVNANSRYMYFSRGRFTIFPIGFFCPKEYYKKTMEFVTKHVNV